jgi:hypothetical protein
MIFHSMRTLSLSHLAAFLALSWVCVGCGTWGLDGAENDDTDSPETVRSQIPCDEGKHNGGDNFCSEAGKCAAGYTLEEDGRCSRWTYVSGASPFRSGHTVTALPDRYILIAGGKSLGTATDNTSLFDSTQDVWLNVNALPEGRYAHTTILLSGNRALLAGGFGEENEPVAPCYIFRGDIGDWISAGVLNTPRTGHGMADIGPFGIAVLGGVDTEEDILASIEIFAGGEWLATESGLQTGRNGLQVTQMLDDRLLISGGADRDGYTMSSVEIFDPDTKTSVFTGSMADDRSGHQTVRLSTGQILAIGGYTQIGSEKNALRTVEIYDPETETWSDTGFLRTPRYGHSLVVLNDDRILVIGGFASTGEALQSVETYVPDLGLFTEATPLLDARGDHGAGVLDDSRVLVVQGTTAAGLEDLVSTDELYQSGD